jgi:RNA polymerase sigma-70 factor (ECF subfamily)
MVNKPKKPNPSAIIPLKHTEVIRQFEKKTDPEIWSAFDKGDEMAFNYIYRCYTPAMFNFGHQITPREELVQDCIQNLFIGLRRKRGALSEVVSIKSYLFKILQRELFRSLKKEKLKQFQEPEFPHSSFLIEVSHEIIMIQQESESERSDQLEKAINQLTPRQRQAVLLLYEEGMSYKEIAEVLELNEVKSARKLIYRALDTLKEIIRK